MGIKIKPMIWYQFVKRINSESFIFEGNGIFLVEYQQQ